jgi:hypothetical protein
MAMKEMSLPEFIKQRDVIIAQFAANRAKEAEIKQEYEELKEKAEELMAAFGDASSIESSEFKITKSCFDRETMCKKDVPPSVWDKYKKTSQVVMFRVSKAKKTIKKTAVKKTKR